MPKKKLKPESAKVKLKAAIEKELAKIWGNEVSSVSIHKGAVYFTLGGNGSSVNFNYQSLQQVSKLFGTDKIDAFGVASNIGGGYPTCGNDADASIDVTVSDITKWPV